MSSTRHHPLRLPRRLRRRRVSGRPAWAAAAIVLALPLAALPEDAEQPIHVEADHGTFNPDGESVLTGAVALRQGTLRLSAHRMTLAARDRRINRIVAVGQGDAPATFRQRPRAGEGVVDARAQRIDYAVSEQRIVLTGRAVVVQADQELSADVIDWNIEAGRVEARANEPGGVKVTWQPEAPNGN